MLQNSFLKPVHMCLCLTCKHRDYHLEHVAIVSFIGFRCSGGTITWQYILSMSELIRKLLCFQIIKMIDNCNVDPINLKLMNDKPLLVGKIDINTRCLLVVMEAAKTMRNLVVKLSFLITLWWGIEYSKFKRCSLSIGICSR